MTNNDVKQLLDVVAADAPELRGILGPKLLRRIARRRKARAIGLGVFAGAGVIGLAMGLASLPRTGQSPESGRPAGSSGESTDRPATGRLRTPLACGSRIGDPSTETPIRLTAAVPVRLFPDKQGRAQVKVTVANGSGGDIEGISSASPSAVLAKDGIVVAEGQAIPAAGRIIKLNPGQTAEFAAAASVKACDVGAGGGRRLEPGEYQLYATLGFQYRDTNGTMVGRSIEILGGPWTAIVE